MIDLTANIGAIDSKFRFIILAAKRARQLQSGAKPLIASQSKRPTQVAQEEVAAGLVKYEISADPERREKQSSKATKSKGATKKIASQAKSEANWNFLRVPSVSASRTRQRGI